MLRRGPFKVTTRMCIVLSILRGGSGFVVPCLRRGMGAPWMPSLTPGQCWFTTFPIKYGAESSMDTEGMRTAARKEGSQGSVIVARGKARLFWEGNPLVYGGAVAKVEGSPKAGDIVDVVDSSGKFIAWGVYNPTSMYRVRILVREGDKLADCRDIRAVVQERLKTARSARHAIGIPNPDTNTYR
ncbi:unnamed protein product, partial [Choristocarpus tenellus]